MLMIKIPPRTTVFLMLIIISIQLFPLVTVTNTQAELPRDQTLFVTGAQWTPPSTWNPIAPSQTWGTSAYGGFLYLPLFQYVPGLDKWIPIIGEDFKFINPYVLRIHIRPEAKWSDGEPITAYDVVFTYNVSLAVGSGPMAGAEPYVAKAVVVDEKTVDFYINNETRNYYMFLLYTMQLIPVPKHIFEDVYNQINTSIIEWRNCGGLCDDIVNKPQVVSGPYKLYYFDELRVVYERIDDWWGKDIFGLPGPKYLVHRIYLSNEQAILDLMQGNVDWSGIFIPRVWQLFPNGVGTYYKNRPYYRPNQILVLYINNRISYLRDPILKKAIAYAIDYNELIEKAWYGYTTQASMSFVFEIYPQYKQWINTTLAQKYWGNPEAKVQTNKDYARQLLDQAGYIDRDGDGYRDLPNGRPFNITIMVPTGWTDWMLAADLIAQDLKDIGINAQSFPVDYGAYWGYIQGATYSMVMGWLPAPTFFHPWDSYRYLLDPRLTPPIGNWEWYNNTEVIDILEKAAKAITPEERMKYYSKLQKIIYEDIPSIALVYTPQWYEYSTNIWDGWPNEDNPWWTEVAPYREYTLSLWLLFGLKNRGEPVSPPQWAKSISEGGILIPNIEVMKRLANATHSPLITTTTTTTPGATSSPTTITSTVTSPTTTTPGGRSRTTNLLIALTLAVIIIIGIIIGVRMLLRRKTT
jgi:peptide/nickel transport system substrate-binding protein